MRRCTRLLFGDVAAGLSCLVQDRERLNEHIGSAAKDGRCGCSSFLIRYASFSESQKMAHMHTHSFRFLRREPDLANRQLLPKQLRDLASRKALVVILFVHWMVQET